MMFQTRKTIQKATMIRLMKSEKGLEIIAGLEDKAGDNESERRVGRGVKCC